MPQCGYPDSGLEHGATPLRDTYVKRTVWQIVHSLRWKTTKYPIVVGWVENDHSASTGCPGRWAGKNGVLGGGRALCS